MRKKLTITLLMARQAGWNVDFEGWDYVQSFLDWNIVLDGYFYIIYI